MEDPLEGWMAVSGEEEVKEPRVRLDLSWHPCSELHPQRHTGQPPVSRGDVEIAGSGMVWVFTCHLPAG